jgi:hypothetical protein
MMRRTRFIALLILLVLISLACNAVTQPLNQAQEVVETAQSLATAMPVETLMAIPSALPTELSGFDLTSVPGFDATNMPFTPDCFDPKSDPQKEWNDIPVMPGALAGEECTDMYVFTVAAAAEEVKVYYDEALKNLGWEIFPGMGDTGAGGLFLIYQKDGAILSIIVTPSTQKEGVLLVMLTKS